VIVDIGMRMLTPRELFNAQGFPPDYIIDRDAEGRPITKTAQVAKCGNSVCPPIARGAGAANVAEARCEAAMIMYAQDPAAVMTALRSYFAACAEREVRVRETHYPAMIEAGTIARDDAEADLGAWRDIAACSAPARSTPRAAGRSSSSPPRAPSSAARRTSPPSPTTPPPRAPRRRLGASTSGSPGTAGSGPSSAHPPPSR
jgi:hypothetical protein